MFTRQIRRVCAAALGITSSLLVAAMLLNSGRAQVSEQDKPVEQVQKNIQVLKGMPNAQLLPVMHQMRTALGVRCDYCHIAENGKYGLDDKPAKQTARRMLQMVFALNRDHFGGRPVVTCNSCHRGSTKPVAMPAIGQGAFANTTKGEAAPAPAPLPTVDEVLDRYIQVLGGRAAIEKIESRVAKLTLLRPKLINAGTPDAAMITRGESWQMEVWQKAPDKYLAVITTPSGVIQQGFNGVSGWVQTAEGQRAMSSAAVAQVRRQADLRAELKLKERYSALKVIGRERVGAHDTYVIEAASPNQRKEKLYFDTQSGLLLRRVALSETILGDDPEQTDYEDYREVGGVKLPFTIIVSFLDDSHYGTTRRYAEIKHNAPVDDARFNPPAAAK